MSLIPDEYELRARLRPTLLVSLPPTLAVMSWFPDLSGMQFLVGVFTFFGLTALLSQLGRDQGKRRETWLFEQWGGIPTTQLLRHDNKHLALDTKRRYHASLARLIPQMEMPTEASELADIAAAEEKYDSCVAFLRERTRDKKSFPLVFAENVNYGFRRNLWGMRRVGIVLSLASLVAALIAVIIHADHDWPPAAPIVAALISAFMLTWWSLRITPTWVRLPAIAYAERLLATTETLGPPTPSSKRLILGDT